MRPTSSPASPTKRCWGRRWGQPFYLQLDYTAPHGDFRRPAGPEPATRHYDSFSGAPFPHGPSEGFNEGNVNDKPRFIREAPYLSPTDIHTYRVYYQKMLESLRSIDDGVKQIVDTLGAMHQLRNTYIIFTSDNGFFFGEHRLTGGKFLAYEPSTHLPFLIRGPGIKPGTSTGELAANIDIAPTVLELAGAQADKSIDGRSLVPYLLDPDLRTRRPILFESFVETNDVEENGGGPAATPASVAAGRSGGGNQINDGRPARCRGSGAEPAPRSWRRPRTTRESASAPTSTSSGPTARKSSTTSTRTRTSSTTWSATPTSSRSAPSCTASWSGSRPASGATARKSRRNSR